MAKQLPGSMILEHLELIDGVVTYKKRIATGHSKVGDPVAIRIDAAGREAYYFAGCRYKINLVTNAIQEQDPEWIDNPSAKMARGIGTLSDRDMDIYAALKLGTVYADIGATYGVSRQRIKQIVDKLAKHGLVVSARDERSTARAAAYQNAKTATLGEHHTAISESPHLTQYLTSRLAIKQHNAKSKGIACDLTISDLYPLPDRCPILDIPLDYTCRNGYNDDAMAIDRIDNTRGYVKGNIVLISQRANRIKNDATVEELLRIADFYKRLTTMT